MDGVHVDHRPHPVGGFGHPGDVDHGAQRIGRRGYRHQPGPIVEKRLELVVVECPGLHPDPRPVDSHPALPAAATTHGVTLASWSVV